MDLLLEVVSQITLPVVVLAAFGFLLQKRVGYDVQSLNKLLIYATLPAFLLHTLWTAELPLTEVRVTVVFTLAQFAVLAAVGWWSAAALGQPRDVRAIMAFACGFPNSGNYGIPVIELAFGGEAVVHQAVITAVMTIVILVAGPFMFARREGGLRGHLKTAFETPLIPAVALGLTLNALDVPLPHVAGFPLELMGSAYTAVALFALGAQLASGDWPGQAIGRAGLGLGLRLLVAPLLTWAALAVLPLSPLLEAVLLVGACAPVGVLVVIFAGQYRGNAALASAVVMASTVLSPLVVTAAVIVTRL
jgi:predicted permease